MNDTPQEVEHPDEVPRDFRVLMSSDYHLHEWPDCSWLETGMNSRLVRGVEAVAEVRSAAIEHEVQAVRVLGDAVHTGQTRVPAAVAEHGVAALASMLRNPADVLMVGNHDQPGRRADETVLRWVDASPITLVDRPTVLDDAGRRTVAFPYYRDLGLFAEAVAEYVRPGDVVLCHQGIRGAALGPEGDYFLGDEEVDPAVFQAAGAAVVFAGHYHKPQTVAGGLVVYVGAFMQHTFGERGNDPRMVLFDAHSLRWCSLPMKTPPRFHKVEVATLKEAKALAAGATGRDYLWAVLPPEGKASPAKVREVLGDRFAFLRIDDSRKRAERPQATAVVTHTMSNADMVGAYVDHATLPDGVEPERVKALAVDYLNRSRSES